MRDGVFRYKRKWGARFAVRADQYFDLYLGWQRPTAAVMELLRHSPLLVREGNGISALGALAPTGPDQAGSDQGLARAKELETLGTQRTILMGSSGVTLPGSVCLLDLVNVDSSERLGRALAATR